MRHKHGHRKLGKPTDQRIALLRNQVSALFQHGQMTTTEIRAKEVSSLADRLITKAKAGVAVSASPERKIAAMRQVRRFIQRPPLNPVKTRKKSYFQQPHPEREVLQKLFEEIAPKFVEREGGYTRVIKGPPRRGDGSPTAIVALVAD